MEIVPDVLPCNSCGENKSFSAFKKDLRRPFYARGNRHTTCKSCENEKRRARYEILPDEDDRIASGSRCCNTCKTEKPLTSFTKCHASPLGRHTKCKECCNAWDRAKRRERGLLKPGTGEGKFNQQEYHRLRYRGVSADAFTNMFNSQGGKCDICESPLDPMARTTVIDHDHSTGFVRGILCNACNSAIGFMRDDVWRLEKAIVYLQRHGVKNAA